MWSQKPQEVVPDVYFKLFLWGACHTLSTLLLAMISPPLTKSLYKSLQYGSLYRDVQQTFIESSVAYDAKYRSTNYNQLYDCEYHLTLITHNCISIVSVQMPRATEVAQENGQGSYQNLSSTQSFNDTQDQ